MIESKENLVGNRIRHRRGEERTAVVQSLVYLRKKKQSI